MPLSSELRSNTTRQARLLHPAANPQPGEVPFDALEQIADGLARIERSVPLVEGADPTVARSLRMIATPAYDVWLITWPPGSAIGWHDHGASTSVIRVVQGTIVESTSLVAGSRPRSTALSLGVGTAMAPHQSHDLHNQTDAPATTLHVYSPPLADMTFADRYPAAAGSPARRKEVPTTRAEASSSPALESPALEPTSRGLP